MAGSAASMMENFDDAVDFEGKTHMKTHTAGTLSSCLRILGLTRTLGGALAATLVGSLLMVTSAAAEITINGYGHYCSMTWPTGGWAFVSDSTGTTDPCRAIMGKSDPGGTIARAGMYHASGMNTVVLRCTDNTVWQYKGNGNGPLTAAYDKAKGHPGCIFTVAPQELPIFNSPFKGTTPRTTNGFDFAKPPYQTLNVPDFGQSGPSNAKTVNLRGNVRTYGDDHDGYDWVVPEGTAVYAVADGVVHANRRLATTCTNSKDHFQGEMYIRHTVSRIPSRFNEIFVAGYFHLKKRADLAAGTSVKAGDYLGDIGWVGCSSESHLHFALFRTTNVADHWKAPFSVPNNETDPNNGGRWATDPYGFKPPKGIDPWGWRAFPDGALSIDVWKSGQAPPIGDWGP